jgi:hypothetical protein
VGAICSILEVSDGISAFQRFPRIWDEDRTIQPAGKFGRFLTPSGGGFQTSARDDFSFSPANQPYLVLLP